MKQLFIASCVIGIALTGMALTAHAQSADESRDREARILFQAGQLAFEEGRFDNALESFQRAYDLTQRPELLFNVGASLERLERFDDALVAFRAYLEQRPDADNRAAVEQRIRLLEVAAAANESAEEPSRSAGPWVLIGAGVGSIVAGVVLVGMAQRDLASVEDPGMPGGEPPRWEDFENRNDRAPRRAAIGFALGGVGVALLAAGVVWRVTEDVSVAPLAGGAQVRAVF